jgi:hypothetical protein
MGTVAAETRFAIGDADCRAKIVRTFGSAEKDRALSRSVVWDTYLSGNFIHP